MKLTPEEKQGMSPSEIAALEGTGVDAALATMGDDAPTVQAGAADAGADDADDDTTSDDGGDNGTEANTAAQGDNTTADGAALTAEQLAAIAQDTQAADPAKLPTYEVQNKDFDAERKTLRQSRKDIQAKWDEGELSDEQLQAELDAIDDKIDALTAERVRADTLRELNEQHAREAQAKVEAEYSAATTAIIKQAAASPTSKVDYLKDKAAQRQFDMALDMLQADEANASKTPAQLVAEAHKAVLVIRGLPIGAPAPTPAPAAPTPPKPRDVPVTLGGLPNASQVPLQDETMAQASRLSGEDLEQFLARLTPAQQQRLLRSTDNAVAH